MHARRLFLPVPPSLALCATLSLLWPSTALARSGGAAASLASDRTGSPLSSGTCASCHNGGSGVTLASFRVFDGALPVTEVDPGASYVVELQVTNPTMSLFGAQLVGLDSNNAQAGSFGAISTANTQISTLAGVSYLEHDSRSATGIFRAAWTAPSTPGPVNF